MRAAHHPSSQSHRCHRVIGFAALLALGACASEDLAPSLWPPADFEFHAEQIVLGLDGVQVQRRLRVFADGVVVYGTATGSLRGRVDAAGGPTIALPVFDRLAVYRLVPNALRAFARRLDRLGVATMAARQGDSTLPECAAVRLCWRAFGAESRILAQGRVSGAMADILGAIATYLPAGERFDLPGSEDRLAVPVLRSVPAPQSDRATALVAHESLCQGHADERLLLDTFTLACANGDRARAQRWLARYGAAAGAAAPSPEPRLDEQSLQRFLPPQ